MKCHHNDRSKICSHSHTETCTKDRPAVTRLACWSDGCTFCHQVDQLHPDNNWKGKVMHKTGNGLIWSEVRGENIAWKKGNWFKKVGGYDLQNAERKGVTVSPKRAGGGRQVRDIMITRKRGGGWIKKRSGKETGWREEGCSNGGAG